MTHTLQDLRLPHGSLVTPATAPHQLSIPPTEGTLGTSRLSLALPAAVLGSRVIWERKKEAEVGRRVVSSSNEYLKVDRMSSCLPDIFKAHERASK